MTDYTELANLYASLFVSRPDVKAQQGEDGGYRPVVEDYNAEPKKYRPFKRKDFEDHASGRRTYGHYMLSTDNQTKLMAFDIDLDTVGKLPQMALPLPIGGVEGPIQDQQGAEWEASFADDNPREAWLNRRHPARQYMKYCMMSIALHFESALRDLLGLETAVAYTGNKGLHVYGFTGKMPAAEVRDGAMLVIDHLPILPLRGKAFYQWDPSDGKPERDIFTIEVFPKQAETSSSGGFGNLMRLPLGINRKNPKDPTFFVDMERTADLRPVSDPVALLRRIKENTP